MSAPALLGFADPQAARAAATRTRIRRHLSSLAERMGARDFDLGEERAEVVGNGLLALLQGSVALSRGYLDSSRDKVAIRPVDGEHQREQELRESAHLVLGLGETLLNVLGHDASSVTAAGEDIDVAAATHRLSEVAK